MRNGECVRSGKERQTRTVPWERKGDADRSLGKKGGRGPFLDYQTVRVPFSPLWKLGVDDDFDAPFQSRFTHAGRIHVAGMMSIPRWMTHHGFSLSG